MIRLILGIAIIAGLVWGAGFLMGLDQPITINTGTYIFQPSLGQLIFALCVLVILVILVWAMLRRIIGLPRFLNRRNKQHRLQNGLDQLSASIIANEAGLFDKARTFAKYAAKNLPNNVAAKLIQAKSAAQSGHLTEAREIWRTMIEDQQSAPIALKGLFDEAQKRQNHKAALIFARKAVAIAPNTKWANRCVFDDFVRHKQFQPALDFVHQNKSHQAFSDKEAKRHKIVLNTALAQEYEADGSTVALNFAKAALKVDKGFVPAALIAARLQAKTQKYRAASNLLTRAYKAAPHPQLAELYGQLRADLPADQQLARVEKIAQHHPIDAAIAQAIAQFALKADDVKRAKQVLAPFAKDRPSKNICALMAKIEQDDTKEPTKAQQWLAASIHAPLDACWTADGFVANEWTPLSPNSEKYDSFEWRVPMKDLDAKLKLEVPELDWQPVEAAE